MNIFQLTKKIVNTNKDQIYNIFSSEALLRVVAWYVTPIFYYLRLSPNSISVIALMTGLYGSLLIFQNGADYISNGVIFFILSVIIDHCDGNIARLKNDLYSVNTIMSKNIDLLIDRDNTLKGMQSQAEALKAGTRKVRFPLALSAHCCL